MNFSPRRILIRVDGSKEIGLGHVYNMITVLHSFKKDSLLIVMQKNSKLGANKFLKFNIPVKYFNEMESLEKIIKKFNFKNNLILSGGIYEINNIRKIFQDKRVVACSLGNNLNYGEHKIQKFKSNLESSYLRKPFYSNQS